jgi:hypothetical protein
LPHAEKVSRRFCPHHPLERGVAATLCRPVFARTERSACPPARTIPRRVRGHIFYCVGWMPRATPLPTSRPVGVPTTAFTGLQPPKTALHRAARPPPGRTTHNCAAVPQNVPSWCTPLAPKRRLRGTDRADPRVIRVSPQRPAVFLYPARNNFIICGRTSHYAVLRTTSL